MRAFTNSQQDLFLNAFGETISTDTGTTFRAILEMVPVSISTTGGFIEGYETYATAKKEDVTFGIDTVLIIHSVSYTVYNIVDDLSGMVDIYYRTTEGQHFAEDY